MKFKVAEALLGRAGCNSWSKLEETGLAVKCFESPFNPLLQFYPRNDRGPAVFVAYNLANPAVGDFPSLSSGQLVVDSKTGEKEVLEGSASPFKFVEALSGKLREKNIKFSADPNFPPFVYSNVIFPTPGKNINRTHLALYSAVGFNLENAEGSAGDSVEAMHSLTDIVLPLVRDSIDVLGVTPYFAFANYDLFGNTGFRGKKCYIDGNNDFARFVEKIRANKERRTRDSLRPEK